VWAGGAFKSPPFGEEDFLNIKARHCARAFHFYLESMEMLYGFVFAAKHSDQVTPPDRALL